MKAIHVQFPRNQFILRFGDDIFKPKPGIYEDPFTMSNYISWRDAVCGYPHFMSRPSKITGLTENGKRDFIGSRLLDLRMIGLDPCQWIVNLPPIKAEIYDDDGYDGSDEETFSWYFKTFLEDLEEEEAELDKVEIGSYIYT